MACRLCPRVLREGLWVSIYVDIRGPSSGSQVALRNQGDPSWYKPYASNNMIKKKK